MCPKFWVLMFRQNLEMDNVTIFSAIFDKECQNVYHISEVYNSTFVVKEEQESKCTSEEYQ